MPLSEKVHPNMHEVAPAVSFLVLWRWRLLLKYIFKILIKTCKMCPLSTDGAILIVVIMLFEEFLMPKIAVSKDICFA